MSVNKYNIGHYDKIVGVVEISRNGSSTVYEYDMDIYSKEINRICLGQKPSTDYDLSEKISYTIVTLKDTPSEINSCKNFITEDVKSLVADFSEYKDIIVNNRAKGVYKKLSSKCNDQISRTDEEIAKEYTGYTSFAVKHQIPIGFIKILTPEDYILIQISSNNWNDVEIVPIIRAERTDDRSGGDTIHVQYQLNTDLISRKELEFKAIIEMKKFADNEVMFDYEGPVLDTTVDDHVYVRLETYYGDKLDSIEDIDDDDCGFICN